MTIGDRLIQLRLEKGVYQKELAAYLNVTIGTISNYENGVHLPDLNTLQKLAAYYDVTTDYLLGKTSFKKNISYLNDFYVDNLLLSDFISAALELSPKNRQTLLEQMDLLKLRDEVQQTVKNKA